MPNNPLHSRYLFRAITATLVIGAGWHLSWFRDHYTIVQPDLIIPLSQLPPPPAAENPLLPCESLRGLDDVFLIMRTGANEAPYKLPPHFNTTLRCMPQKSYGIWSDFEEDIDGHHVQDALSKVDPDIIANNSDFAYYRRLQNKGRAAFSDEQMALWASAPNSGGGRDTPGWQLDKWKFLPLAEQAYHQRPDAKWYIFMEADGYINWSGVLSWLSLVDASRRFYAGHLMIAGSVLFGYGGAGCVISNPSMKALVEHRAAMPGFYEDFTSRHWPGDSVLGKALQDSGTGFIQAWPNLLGDSPFDVNYGDMVRGTDVRVWCYAALTWHHLSPSAIKELFEFEQRWNLEHSGLLRHSDVFRHLVLPKLGPKMEGWENLSSGEESVKNSFDECRGLCESHAGCVQFAFYNHTRVCKTSNTVRLGYRQQDGEALDALATSGWLMDRVHTFTQDLDTRCHEEDWVSFQ